MKHMKKAVTLLLTLAMTLSLTVTAFAAGTVAKDYNKTNGATATDGTITITGIHEDSSSGTPHTKYEVYKMLHLESYHVGSGGSDLDAYSYVMVDEWEDFFRNNSVAQQYITISPTNYVTWSGNKTAADLNAFADAALAYAETNHIDPVMTSDTTLTGNILAGTASGYNIDGTTGTFYGLSLGYYLIDSNVGILCGLTTTNPNATVNAKNGAPTLTKQVQEDSALESGTASWFDENTAEIGQVVNYDVTINAYAGAEDYVYHDKMGAGLTYDPTSLKVYYYDPDTFDPAHPEADKKVLLTEGTDYVITHTGCTAGCTFHVAFQEAFLDNDTRPLKTNDKIYITYSAKLNKNAVVGGAGNPNEAWLDYGEDHHTTHDITTTYTYGFDLVKTNSGDKLLDGAQFKLYADDGMANLLKFVLDGGTYRLATATETGEEILNVVNGKIRITGLDNGHYYLEEIAAPAGYNKLLTLVDVSISNSNRYAVVTGDTLTGGTPVQVINNTGALLPHTGGMGTTLFITCGTIAVLGAGVLLVTKKRMGMIED